MDLPLTFELTDGRRASVSLENAVIAGWTARDRAAVDHHIEELAALGVRPPSSVPLFYRVAASLFTTAGKIEVVGGGSSGEAEPVLLDDGGRLWLGLGSDHTDRELEAHSVALSKQVCAKPLAGRLWPFEEVRDHLDALELRSWIRNDAAEDWIPYQDGALARIRPLEDLVALAPLAAGGGRLRAGTAMMCGTLPVLSGGVRPARFFRMELRDPVRGRALDHSYEIHVLPVVA